MVSEKGSVTNAPSRTARSSLSTGSFLSSAILSSAVDQLASASTITSGSAATTFSQLTSAQPPSRSAKMFVAPTASRISCGPPSPAPAKAVLSPESYQKTSRPSPGALSASASSWPCCSSSTASARSATSNTSPTISISFHTDANETSALGWFSPQPNSDRNEPMPSSASSSCGPAAVSPKALPYEP